MKRRSVIFKKPYEVVLQEEPLPVPKKGEVLVKTDASAISTGTEMLVFRGLIPSDQAMDTTIKSLRGTFKYPLKYGYSTVGQVEAVGAGVKQDWLGRKVFCFHAHESHFAAKPADLFPIPASLDALDALFLPNMETAVNFLMDGRPLIGERVVVFGQGIVGLLTTCLLAMFPLAVLISLDAYPLRRETSLRAGANASIDPAAEKAVAQLRKILQENEKGTGTADIIYEMSGNLRALNQALAIAGFQTRIVVGSWYGKNNGAEVDLGTRFHRNRLHLISSQVSSIAPEYSGRWTKRRRFQTAGEMIKRIKPSRFITHQYSLDKIKQAFELLNQTPEQALQVILTYH
jgi:2-desacetyl-2-hydroxyethyl bacteriochlorophyllide A dehydrogenase